MRKNFKFFNLRKVSALLLLVLMISSLFVTTIYAADETIDKSKGNVRIVSKKDSHTIPYVTKYLNNKYGTFADPDKKVVPHVNVELYLGGKKIKDYQLVTYTCPDTKRNGSLIYDRVDGKGISDICPDKNITREELGMETLNVVKELGNDALESSGASLEDIVSFVVLWLLVAALILPILLGCAVFIL